MAPSTAILLAVFTIVSVGPVLVASDCVWHGVCNFDGTHYQNCPYSGPGYPLNNDSAIEIIQRRCPEVHSDPDDLVCCTPQSLKIMDDSIAYAEAVYGRCPTCLKNLVRSICAFSCSPKASDFIETYTRPNSAGVEYIHSIDMRISYEYMEAVFTSCSNVVHPASGKKVLDIACGGYDSYMCTPERWFWFMGDASINTLAPFTINYIPTEDPERRFHREVKTCDEPYEGDYQCSCVDCNLACPEAEEPEPESEPFTILDVNGVSFIIGVVVGVLGVAYLTFYFLHGKINCRCCASEWRESREVMIN